MARYERAIFQTVLAPAPVFLMELHDEPRKRRVMDTSNAQARQALADVLTRFGEWRDEIARMQARMERRYSDADRADMLGRCAAIEDGLMAARTELLLTLADAPQRVAGNSRVVDVERALDNIETAVKAVRRKLG